MVNGVADAVDERQDAYDHRHFGTLVEIAALRLFDTQLSHTDVFSLLLKNVVEFVTILTTVVEIIEQPQQEQ